MVAKLTGAMNDTEISITGNQLFMVFQTNIEIVRKGFHALIIESKYIQHFLKILRLFLDARKACPPGVSRNTPGI